MGASQERIGVVGGGGFGTVMAKMLAEQGLTVYQWVRNPEQAQAMEADRENPKYLPGVKLPKNLWFSPDMRTVVEDASIVVMAVPSFAVREVAKAAAPLCGEDSIALNLAKGIEHSDGAFLRMSQVLRQELPEHVAVASLSGPNLAKELAAGTPSGAMVGSTDVRALPRLTRAMSTDTFKVYASQDVVGVELGGVLKNISAVAAGISDGLGFGDNSKASLITLGLYEMFVVGARMGARRETFYGLAGIGDLVATCNSALSRNHTVGELLGQGDSLEQAIEKLQGKVAEGVRATKVFHEYAEAEGLTLPLTEEMYHVLYEGKDVGRAIQDLLAKL